MGCVVFVSIMPSMDRGRRAKERAQFRLSLRWSLCISDGKIDKIWSDDRRRLDALLLNTPKMFYSFIFIYVL